LTPVSDQGQQKYKIEDVKNVIEGVLEDHQAPALEAGDVDFDPERVDVEMRESRALPGRG
jgi:hypothetical protein